MLYSIEEPCGSIPRHFSVRAFRMTLARLFVVFCLFGVAGCATIRRFNPVASNTLEARQLTQEAQAAIHGSAWDEAESKLVTAIEKYPEDNHARSVLADVLWERGAHSAAVEQKTHAIELSGRDDPLELTELGQMEFSTGALDQALEHADKAIELDSSLAEAWTLRGFVLRAQGKPQEALNAFFRSLSIHSRCPRSRIEIARIYQDTNQPQRALAILQSISRSNENDCLFFGDVCFLRGVLLSELGRPGDSIEALQMAREHGCPAEDLTLRLAQAQFAAGQQLKARATLAEIEGQTGPELTVALRDLKQQLEGGAVADAVSGSDADVWLR